MEDEQTLWYDSKQISSLGLASPIKHLLQKHINEKRAT
jgi:hypothetical protein